MRRDRCGAALLAACLGLCAGLVAAQAANQAAPSERAQRDADKVFQWIKIHSDKPRRVRDEKEAKPAAAPPPAAVATPAPRPAARPAPDPAAQRAAAATTASLPNPEPASPAAVEAVPTSAVVAKAAPAAPTPAPPLEPEGEDPLVFVRQVEPEFPGHAMRMLGKGSVQVRFEVKPDGTVGRTEVVKSTSARLNQAAVAAVAQWRFMPVRHAQTGIVDLGFNLD